MKKILLLTMSLFGLGVNAQVTSYSVGDVVNNFTVTDTKGNSHSLYSVTSTGKYVFIDFFFTTCGPCQQTQSFFNNLYDKYGCNEGGLYTLSISGHGGDNNANVDAFEANYGGSFNHSPAISPQGNGAAVTDDFGVQAFPTYCLIGPDNKLILRDIWPVTSLSSFENAFPAGFNPTVMACSVLGVEELSAVDVSVFPTVSKGEFNVSLPSVTDFQLSVVDLNGKEVYANSYQSSSSAALNLSLSPNVYLVNITTSTSAPIVKRIVIQ